VALYQLDGQARFSDSTTTDDDELVLPQELYVADAPMVSPVGSRRGRQAAVFLLLLLVPLALEAIFYVDMKQTGAVGIDWRTGTVEGGSGGVARAIVKGAEMDLRRWSGGNA
jgi:hypothetical protein